MHHTQACTKAEFVWLYNQPYSYITYVHPRYTNMNTHVHTHARTHPLTHTYTHAHTHTLTHARSHPHTHNAQINIYIFMPTNCHGTLLTRHSPTGPGKKHATYAYVKSTIS